MNSQLNVPKQRHHDKRLSSILGRSRKPSNELLKQRPLKRSTSLSFRSETFRNFTVLTDSTKNQIKKRKSNSSLSKLKTKFNNSIRNISGSSSSATTTTLNSPFSICDTPTMFYPQKEFDLVPPSSLQHQYSSPNYEEFDSESESSSNDSTTSYLDNTNDTSFGYFDSSTTTPDSIHDLKFKSFFNQPNISSSTLEHSYVDYARFYQLDSFSEDALDDQFVKSHAIFEIPEIVELIMRYVAEDDFDSYEKPMIRRAPSSYKHAVIQYGKGLGERVWNTTNPSTPITETTLQNINNQSKILYSVYGGNNSLIPTKGKNLHSCLLVNRLFHYTAQQILAENLKFNSSNQFENFIQSMFNDNSQFGTLTANNLIWGENSKLAPISLIFNKVKSLQCMFDIFSKNISGRRLEWLEMYICPNMIPLNTNLNSIPKPSASMDFFQPNLLSTTFNSLITSSLKRLVLPGCRQLSDDDLRSIVCAAPHLKHLDLRACDQLTDAGLWFIGEHALELESLNIGRHTRGEVVSDASIGHIIRHCPLKTLGVAGCGISDWTVWEAGLQLNSSLERFSLNYCWKLTDMGICKVLKAGLLDNLSVLEIKDLKLIDVKEILHWKKRVKSQNGKVLIEACERLDELLMEQSREIAQETTRQTRLNVENWLDEDDSDADWRMFNRNQ